MITAYQPPFTITPTVLNAVSEISGIKPMRELMRAELGRKAQVIQHQRSIRELVGCRVMVVG